MRKNNFDILTDRLFQLDPSDSAIETHLENLHGYLQEEHSFVGNILFSCILRIVVKRNVISPQLHYVLRQILILTVLNDENFFCFLTLLYAHLKRFPISELVSLFSFLNILMKEDKRIFRFFMKYSGINLFFDIYRLRLLVLGKKHSWSRTSHANPYGAHMTSEYIFPAKKKELVNSLRAQPNEKESIPKPVRVRVNSNIYIPRLNIMESISRIQSNEVFLSRSSRRNFSNRSTKMSSGGQSSQEERVIRSSDILRKLWFLPEKTKYGEFSTFGRKIGEFYFMKHIQHLLKVKRDIGFTLLDENLEEKKVENCEVEEVEDGEEEEEGEEEDDDLGVSSTTLELFSCSSFESAEKNEEEEEEEIEIEEEIEEEKSKQHVESIGPREEVIEIYNSSSSSSQGDGDAEESLDDKFESAKFAERRRLNSIKIMDEQKRKDCKFFILKILKRFLKNDNGRRNVQSICNFLMSEIHRERENENLVNILLRVMSIYTIDFVNPEIPKSLPDSRRYRKSTLLHPKSNLFFWRWNGLSSKILNLNSNSDGNLLAKSQVEILRKYLKLCKKKIDMKTFRIVCNQCANCNVNILVEINQKYRRSPDTLSRVLDIFRMMIFEVDDEKFRRNALDFSQSQIIFLKTILQKWKKRSPMEITSIIGFYSGLIRLYQFLGINPGKEIDVLLDVKEGVILGILKSQDNGKWDGKTRVAALRFLETFFKLPTFRLHYFFQKKEFIRVYMNLVYSKFLKLYISRRVNFEVLEKVEYFIKVLIPLVRHRSNREIRDFIYDSKIIEFLVEEMSLECYFHQKYTNRTLQKKFKQNMSYNISSQQQESSSDDDSTIMNMNMNEPNSPDVSSKTSSVDTPTSDTYTDATFDDMSEYSHLSESLPPSTNPLVPKLNMNSLTELEQQDGNEAEDETESSMISEDEEDGTDTSSISEFIDSPSKPQIPSVVPKLSILEKDRKKGVLKNVKQKSSDSVIHSKAQLKLFKGILSFIRRKDGNELKNYENARNNRMLYLLPSLHKNFLYLMLILLIDENHILDPKVLDRLPFQNDMTNILFILHQHINHFTNQKVSTLVHKKILKMVTKAKKNHFDDRKKKVLKKNKKSGEKKKDGVVEKEEEEEHEGEDNEGEASTDKEEIKKLGKESRFEMYLDLVKSECLSLKVLFRLLSKKLYNPNRYKIFKRIGFGAYGEIFEASRVREVPELHVSESFEEDVLSRSGSFRNVYQPQKHGEDYYSEKLALKIIPIEVDIRDFQAVHSTFHEVLVMERLSSNHDCICKILDYGVDNESYYIVMKRYKCNLKQWRSRNKLRPNLPIFVNIFLEILKACKVLHENNICHFDLKAENIYLDYDETKDPFFMKFLESKKKKKKKRLIKTIDENYEDEEKELAYYQQKVDHYFYNQQQKIPTFRIVLGDFGESFIHGLVKSGNLEKFLTNEEYYMNVNVSLKERLCEKFRGTQCICSPEMIRIEMIKKTTRDYDRRKKIGASTPSDIWSLGCIFYELLSNEFLFNPDDFIEFYSKLIDTNIELVSKEKWRTVGCDNLVYDFLNFILVREPNFRPNIDAVISECKTLIGMFPKTLEKYRSLIRE